VTTPVVPSPDLEALLVDAMELRPHPENPRRGDVQGIASSLRRFGQVRPIVVQASSGFIVAGNHTYRAATEELGWSKVAAVRVDLSDDEARAYLIADNRWSDAATNDDAALVAVLERLADDGRLDGTGYSADDVDDLRALIGSLEVEGGATAEHATNPLPEPTEGQRGAGPMPMREIVMLMPVEQAEQFGLHVKRLQSAYGSSGVAATVREAVKREVARLDA
jgi:hypothetical protein